MTGATPEDRPAGKRRVVLIDDDPLVLQMMSAGLEAAGLDVVAATDLGTLERHIAERAPDLVLVDVQMPEAFGDDVAMVLRCARGISAPIYLVSSIDESELSARAAAIEIDGFISKRIGIAAIVERVKTILEAAP